MTVAPQAQAKHRFDMPDLKPFEEQSADHLRLVLRTGQIGIWELDLSSGAAVRNEVHDEIFGYSGGLERWNYDLFLDHVVEADRARVDQLQKSAIAENRDWNFECRITTAGGQERWIQAAGRPMQDQDGKTVKLIGNVIDVTESKRSEAMLRLLTDELNHRVRNMLGMIQSMVRLSVKGAPDLPSFAKALERRVAALARTHKLLVEGATETMLPSTILQAELAAYDGTSSQVRISVVDEVRLGATPAQGLALVLHELLTNALKYGALSNESGRVDVTIDRQADVVELIWKESGGPPVEEAPAPGFGSTLISKSLSGDDAADLLFRREGVECRIRLHAG